MNDKKDIHTTERAAAITYELTIGRELSTSEIADKYGITVSGAEKMLDKISRQVPIYKDNSRWKRI